jgi:hypothetical protein
MSKKRLGDSMQREKVKTLSNDPAISISKDRLGQFERFRPRRLAGKPLSQIVTEERR